MTLAEIRQHYITYRKELYLYQHPDAPPSRAQKYARVAWARKLKKRGIKE